MSSSAEFGNAPQDEYVTAAEMERARQGVETFKELLAANPTAERFLKRSYHGKQLQSMCLGLKPMFGFLTAADAQVVEQLQLPDRFVVSATHVYDPELVEKTIVSNSDIFSDFTSGETDVRTYMDALFALPSTSNDPSVVSKKGLLYGYPKDAVLTYTALSPEQRVVQGKRVDMHGFRYMIVNPTAQTLAFPKKVDEIYKRSGMNDIVASPVARAVKTITRRWSRFGKN